MKKRSIFFAFISLFLATMVLLPSAVLYAQNTGSNPGGGQNTGTNPGLVNPLGSQNSTVEGLLHSIVDWLIKIGTPIAVGMILIGAFQMLFSAGDEEKFKMGKKTILYTAIGYAIILIGWGLTSIIQDFLSH